MTRYFFRDIFTNILYLLFNLDKAYNYISGYKGICIYFKHIYARWALPYVVIYWGVLHKWGACFQKHIFTLLTRTALSVGRHIWHRLAMLATIVAVRSLLAPAQEGNKIVPFFHKSACLSVCPYTGQMEITTGHHWLVLASWQCTKCNTTTGEGKICCRLVRFFFENFVRPRLFSKPR